MPRTSFEITGSASHVLGALQDAAEGVEKLEGSLSSLEANVESVTQGTIRYDEAVQQFRDSSGKFVSATEAQERALSELRDEGIRTEGQIQQQIERLEALREASRGDAVATQELTDKISRLRSELSQAERALKESEVAASRLRQGFSSGVAATGNFTRRQDMLQQELRQTAAAERQVTQAGVTMRSSVGASANNLAFEMTQAAQDMQFGMAGVANQIPLMTRQFSELSAKTGSTAGAITSLTKTFIGPVGLIAAGTLLVQMGPKIIGWLSGTEEELRAVGSESKDAAEAIDSFVESAQDIHQIPNELSKVLTRIQELQAPGTLDVLGGRGGDIFQGAVQALVEEPRGFQFALRIQGLEMLRSQLFRAGVEARTLRNALRAAGVDINTILTGSVEEATEAVRESSEAFLNWKQTLRDFSGTPEAVSDEVIFQFRQMRQAQQSLLDVGIIDEEEAVQRQLSFLESQLEAVELESPFDISGERFQPLLSAYEELSARLKQLKKDAEDADEEGLKGLHARLEKATEAATATWESIKDIGELVEFQDITTEIQDAVFIQERFNQAIQNHIKLLEERARVRRALRAAGLPQGAAEPTGAPTRGGIDPTNVRRPLRQATTGAVEEFGRDFQPVGEVGEPTIMESFRMSIEELQEAFELSEDEAKQFKNQAQTQIAQVIQSAGQLGAALAQAFSKGELSAQQMVSVALSGIGAILSAAGSPVIGAGLGAVSSIVGAFQHGGRVDTPFQILGEEGVELASLPQGTRVHSNQQSKQLFGEGFSRLEKRLAQVEKRIVEETEVLRNKKTGITRREVYDGWVNEDIRRAESGESPRGNHPQLEG